MVFLARPAALRSADRHAAGRALLADDERERLDRFRFERDREVALASRVLQRRALSRCTEIAPAAWRFAADDTGRPRVITPEHVTLAWNVANTLGLVACAITREGELGLDVEPARPDAPPEIVASHFAPSERAALAAVPAPARPRRFVELWTLKEAYLKARSVGLSLPLDQLAFDPSTTPPGFTIDARLDDDPATWQVAQWWPTPAHCLAIAHRGAGSGDPPAPLAVDVQWLDDEL